MVPAISRFMRSNPLRSIMARLLYTGDKMSAGDGVEVECDKLSPRRHFVDGVVASVEEPLMELSGSTPCLRLRPLS